MVKAVHDKSKKGSRRKKSGQSKWRERAKSLGKNLLFAVLCAAVYLSADALMGRTILRGINGEILNFVMILVMALLILLLPIRSWIMGVRDWPSLLLNAFIGWLAGVGLYYLSILVWLGSNYLIPNSEPYERKAVVCGMKAEQRYRQAAHNYVNLRFTDNGEWYRYDADFDEYKSLQPGDTCIVILRDGIWGYPAIGHLQPPEKSVSPQHDIKSLLNHLNERKKDKGIAYGQIVVERVAFCRTHGRIEADSLHAKTAGWRDRIISRFLKFIDGEKVHEGLDYCATYLNIRTEDARQISMDMVRFGDNGCSDKILRRFPENVFKAVDIPTEAPEKCLATRKDSTLIIVWCNLFADDKKVCETVKTILTAEK